MRRSPGSKETLVAAFDDCLQELVAGGSLESVLSRHAALASELRPLLETALAAAAFQHQLRVPAGAQAQSRLRFVNQAHNLVDRADTRRFTFRFRPVALAAVIVACALLALGTGITSAYSKPGDVLYPMKLAGEKTQLLLTTNPVKRLQLQETFDTERLNEVEAVIEQQGTPEVTFSGVLTQSEEQVWSVDQVRLILPETLSVQTESFQGMVVEVHGMMTKDGELALEAIHPHQLDFKGVVQEMTASEWTISQVKVRVDPHTEVNGPAKVGDTVQVEVVRLSDLTLRAVQIDLLSPGSNNRQLSPTVTPQKTEDENVNEDSSEPAFSPSPTNGANHPPKPTPTTEKESEQRISPTPQETRQEQENTSESPRITTPQSTPTREKDGASD
jgi:hypothetical protein